MTPKEIAKSGNYDEKETWFLDSSRTPRELLEYIAESRKQLGYRGDLVENALAVRISETADSSALKLEQYTVKIVALTYVLAALTFGLLILSVVDFVCRR